MRTRFWFRAFLLLVLTLVGSLGLNQFLMVVAPKRVLVNCIDSRFEWAVFLESEEAAHRYILDHVSQTRGFSVCSVLVLVDEEDEE